MHDTTPILPGLAGLADRYDAFIVDLWGVVHDGERAYPGVVDCLRRLRAAGKRVCLLSNAPRRVGRVLHKLREVGVPADCDDLAMSSGELTYEALRDRPDAFHRALGRRCLHVGPPRDDDVYDALDLEVVARPDDASFVLCTGIDDWDDTVADYHDVLVAAVVRDLPMVCANPDLVVVIGTRLAICAGKLAQHYEKMGGRVAYHGKPHREAYDRCLALLGAPDRRRVLVIGDSFHTDLAGARAADLDGVLVTGGIHADELGSQGGKPPDPELLETAITAHGLAPVAAMPVLRW